MSQTAEDLVIIYESEAEQWATYLRSIFTGPIGQDGICCCDIATVTSHRDEFLRLGRYRCKLLVLSRGMVEGMRRLRRSFLSRVLHPASSVVVLLCGVERLELLLDVVPLKAEECLQISTEQDAQEYLSTVTDIVRRGVSAPVVNVNPPPSGSSALQQNVENPNPSGAHSNATSLMVVPSRVCCGSSAEVFLLSKDDVAGGEAEVEFGLGGQRVRVKPVRWNEHIVCVNTPALPAGEATVTLLRGGAPLSKTTLQFYSDLEEVDRLLTRAADPVQFMYQALQVSSVEELDEKLASMLLEGLPSGGFQELQSADTHEREQSREDVPSLLHFAAQNGLKTVASLLLQCPGATRALCTASRRGQTPVDVALSRGHVELHILLEETLNMFNPRKDSGDAGVYELMCAAGSPATADVGPEEEREEEEDPYALLGVNDEEYDTILNPSSRHSAIPISQRPPAPTPRPDNSAATPFIAQVFQKKAMMGNPGTLYSFHPRRAHGRKAGASSASTYDTFVPNQAPKPEQLIRLQERVKRGSLHMDEAPGRFADWPHARKGADAVGQEPPPQQQQQDNDSVYDKINIVHHTPKAAANELRRGSLPAESNFYSKPLKGQSNFFWKAEKR